MTSVHGWKHDYQVLDVTWLYMTTTSSFSSLCVPIARLFSPFFFSVVSELSCRWRTYVREARAPRPRTLDTALLLCEGHGLLLPPPHVEEFLSGERRALLGSLDPRRSGCVCEVLTPEEWDALTLVSKSTIRSYSSSSDGYLL